MCHHGVLRRVQHVEDTSLVERRDTHRGVHQRSRGAAHEQRQAHALSLHRFRHAAHLVQRWRYQSAQADNVHLLANSRLDNLLRRHHHPEVYHLETIAGQYDMHDVLADVMHIAFHRGEQNLASVVDGFGGISLTHIGGEDIHRLLHRAGGLDHLRQEHLAFAEQFAHAVHALHKRSRDNLHRRFAAAEHVLNGCLQRRGVAFLQGGDKHRCTVFCQTALLLDRCAVIGAARRPHLHVGSPLYQSLGGVLPPREEQVLDGFAQVGRDVRILYCRGGIHYRHVHAALHSVVEEDGMDGFA